MFEFIKSRLGGKNPDQDIQSAKPVCTHPNVEEFPEGIRFCKDCKTLERLEKRKFIEAGQSAWEYRALSKEDALAVLDDLKIRMRT